MYILSGIFGIYIGYTVVYSQPMVGGALFLCGTCSDRFGSLNEPLPTHDAVVEVRHFVLGDPSLDELSTSPEDRVRRIKNIVLPNEPSPRLKYTTNNNTTQF